MIVPRFRLLFFAGLMLLPFAALGSALPAIALTSEALVALFAALVLLDAMMTHGSLDGISVELPEVARLLKDREGTLELRIKNEKKKAKQLRLGLAFPVDIHSPNEDLTAMLPGETQWLRLFWPCTAVRRGNYFLDRCYLEATSPLGFWAVRAVTRAHAEIRVYPDLMKERRNLAALFLNRGNFGLHAQRQIGRGRDFEKLRQYMPGDSYDEIHWKATAKRGVPITKVFQIERTQEVYVIIDASRLSGRSAEPQSLSKVPAEGTRGATPSVDNPARFSATVLERFVTAALVLGLTAERQGDLFGVMTFSDKVLNFVRAKNGKGHYSACRDALYRLQAQVVTPDFDDLCTFIRLRLRRRALLVFLTTLDDPSLAESFVRNVELIHRQHLAVVTMLKPPGARPLFSDSDVTSVDDLYRNLGGHTLWHHLKELEKVLHRRGVGFSLLDHEKMSTELVSQYINVKQRQLL